jgi:4-alpha-glucanotransferase
MTSLHALAEAHGVATVWHDIAGVRHDVPDTTLEAVLRGLGVDPSASRPVTAVPPPALGEPWRPLALAELTPGGRYTVELENGAVIAGTAQPAASGGALAGGLPMGLHRLRHDGGQRHLLIAPPRCLTPQELGVERAFGVSAQLYSLKSRRPSVIGDFGDLEVAVELAAHEGADLFGLSPLHALFMADPAARSPYSPSHRAFVNPLYLDVEAAARKLGLAAPTPARAGETLLDYPELARDKRAELEALFRDFQADGDDFDFRRFRAEGGLSLERHCRFEALHEAALDRDPEAWPFWLWPRGWEDADSAEVAAFAERHGERVAFFAFLQWLCDRQLADAQATARHHGMRLGLYRDLAVGVNPAGSMAWSFKGLAVPGLAIGAPPDPLGPEGQNWGLAPFAPTRLAELGYRPLLDDLEANARHAGALRIDHVLGFARQFWIPDNAPASDGTYVGFPFDVMARLCALVSHRHRCVVIGEDLGTVPDGFRERLHEAGMLSCRVLWFERDDERFRRPDEYPYAALASVSTHDLPTVKGFMAGKDVEWRADIGDRDAASRAEAQAARGRDMTALEGALAEAGMGDEPVALALHRFLAASTAALALVQMEDLAGALEQPNLPGTVDEHPNWRRRLPTPVEDVFASPFARDLLAAMRAQRPR